eukprot:360894-Chlamydomonas_euryale.AAC.4
MHAAQARTAASAQACAANHLWRRPTELSPQLQPAQPLPAVVAAGRLSGSRYCCLGCAAPPECGSTPG